MSTIRETAEQFFDACETGKGWDGCAPYCHAGATFASQTDALAGIDTLEAYTEWMKNLLTPLPDGVAEVKSFAVDETRNNVAAYGVFRGRTPAKAVRSRRPARARPPTTSTSWTSTGTRSAT